MGNALRFLYGKCCAPSTQESDFLGPHGVTSETVGVSALARDLFHFEITSQVIIFVVVVVAVFLLLVFIYKSKSRAVWGFGYLIVLILAFIGSNYLVPDGLSQHVVSSKKAQANWYRKLLDAWKEAKPPPKTPEEAARLIIQTLKSHKKADVEGLLAFYGLPLSHTLIETSGIPSSWPQGVKFELQTLPVDVKSVSDGDTITVYIDTQDPRESSSVPEEVKDATIRRSKARAVRNYAEADALQQKIVDAGYRVLNGQHNQDILARKYRIRLRGIDAPESKMPFGKEGKQELVKLVQGKCLKVHVYGEDRYGRLVGDVYCNGIFVQEMMLKKGLAWHYIAYDQRPEFALWEREARASRIGLWASSNPEKPWEWRKNRREGT